MLLLTVRDVNQNHTVLLKDWHGWPPFRWPSASIIPLHLFFSFYSNFLSLSTRVWASQPRSQIYSHRPFSQEYVGTWTWKSSGLLRHSGTPIFIIFLTKQTYQWPLLLPPWNFHSLGIFLTLIHNPLLPAITAVTDITAKWSRSLNLDIFVIKEDN